VGKRASAIFFTLAIPILLFYGLRDFAGAGSRDDRAE
jgi:hypothetical protein